MRRAARSLAAAAALALSALIAAGFLGALWPPLDLAAHFRLHAAVACALAAAIATALGARRAGLAGALATAVGAAGLGPALAPAARPPQPGATVPVTIAVANVDFFNHDSARAEQALADLGADVLVTLETASESRGPEGALAGAYAAVVNRARYVYTGNWLWTNFAVADGIKTDTADAAPAMVWARMAAPQGASLDVLGLHFRRPVTEQQSAQIAGLADAVPALRRPLVVVGDFNAAPWSAAVAQVAATLGVEVVGGLRLTWTSRRLGWLGPLAPVASLPIDHILVSPEVGVDWARTFVIPGSDHRGVVARLQVPLG